jgi:hypothetical protein
MLMDRGLPALNHGDDEGMVTTYLSIHSKVFKISGDGRLRC